MNKLKFAINLCLISSMYSCGVDKSKISHIDSRDNRRTKLNILDTAFNEGDWKELNEIDKEIVRDFIYQFLSEDDGNIWIYNCKNCEIVCKALKIQAPSYNFRALDDETQRKIILEFRNFLEKERNDENLGIVEFLEKYTEEYFCKKLKSLNNYKP